MPREGVPNLPQSNCAECGDAGIRKFDGEWVDCSYCTAAEGFRAKERADVAAERARYRHALRQIARRAASSTKWAERRDEIERLAREALDG